MDNSLTLARHLARLVWLLIHESQNVDEQTFTLREAVSASKEASTRLGSHDGRLTVNGLEMPQELAGVKELAEQLGPRGIDEIEIEQGAATEVLLSLAKLLASARGPGGGAAQGLATFAEEKVHVRLAPAPEAASEAPPAGASGATPTAEPTPLAGRERVEHLWALLARVNSAADAVTLLSEIAFLAEQATREGRPADAANIFTALLDRESSVTDSGIRRAFFVTVRRLTRPILLRALARLVSAEPERAAQAERILQRCEQDGVDAAVDQFSAAPSSAVRRLYRDVLSRLPAAREALVQMLSDPRWFVVRRAAELLGEMGTQEAERPLAELLGHKDERVRRAATRALARIESSFAVDALARALADDATVVRLEAVAALASRKGSRAGSLLAKAIDEERDQEVQHAVLSALGRVATPEAVQKLSSAAAAGGRLFKAKKDNALRIAAVQALGEAHTGGALAALQGLLNDREKDVREAVARTMRGGAERDVGSSRR